jgi:hypothetical protein
MNGKRLRVGGCYGRAAPRRSVNRIEMRNISKVLYKYNLPIFTQDLKNRLSSDQKDVLYFFENYKYKNISEPYNYEGNTKGSIIYLDNDDFLGGTVRIKTPGIYILRNNINFNPNEEYDFKPTDFSKYPHYTNGPYHLGFFAAITIECDDVILDLNGKTIRQSKKHNIQQRFYANIELASSPFVPKIGNSGKSQGPGDFTGDTIYRAANRVLIYNGTLGQSSHHGIHANLAHNVVIHNLQITNFEVAGIALNGTINAIINNNKIHDSKKDVPILSTYSQARFIVQILERMDQTLMFGSKSVFEILSNINTDLSDTYNAIITGKKLPDNYFKNPFPKMGYDGNVYGIVLNIRGVVVNNFITKRTPEMFGNKNIHLSDNKIYNIQSNPLEIIGINSNPSSENAYGGKVQVGPFGDVFQIKNLINSDGVYKGNSLSDAQLIISKYKNNIKNTTANISIKIQEWALSKSNIDVYINDVNKLYYVGGGDSMSHHMKGSIGLFISAGENISCWNTTIHNIINHSEKIVDSLVQYPPFTFGSNAYGILLTASKNIYFVNTYIWKVQYPVKTIFFNKLDTNMGIRFSKTF